MPRRRIASFPSLYEKCMKIVHDMILDFCSNMEVNYVPNKSLALENLHEHLIKHVPVSVLDDLLNLFNQYQRIYATMKQYYFYRVVTHPQMKYFEARNYQLQLSYWESLFKTTFSNLIKLNLALSCNDQILELISIYCPKLEEINATCKYERIAVAGNACTFALSVTDIGLNFLCKCKKLRIITVNEPRSNNHCRLNGITYQGLRKLLIEIPTLEDISYSDLGSVVAQGLERLPTLKLRIIRHFNPTLESINEILRLCYSSLRELYLTFFHSESQDLIWEQVKIHQLQLHTLEVVNFKCDQYIFSDIFQKFGENLSYLSIINNIHSITLANILVIGRYCRNLKFFNCTQIICDANRNHCYLITRNNWGNQQYFTELQHLYLSGENMFIESILNFFIKNALNLETLRFMEKGKNLVKSVGMEWYGDHENYHCVFPIVEDLQHSLNDNYYRCEIAPTNLYDVDLQLINCIRSNKLKYLEVSTKIPFTINILKIMLKKFPLLNNINVFCIENSKEFLNIIRNDIGCDLVFSNKHSCAIRV